MAINNEYYVLRKHEIIHQINCHKRDIGYLEKELNRFSEIENGAAITDYERLIFDADIRMRALRCGDIEGKEAISREFNQSLRQLSKPSPEDLLKVALTLAQKNHLDKEVGCVYISSVFAKNDDIYFIGTCQRCSETAEYDYDTVLGRNREKKIRPGSCPSCYITSHERCKLRSSFPGTYTSWLGAIDRCTNPNNANYKHYGGRGIKICDEWKNDFKIFLQDMGPRPDGLSIDRINVDGNYEASNCRWADWKTQANNKRTNKWYKEKHQLTIKD